MEAVVEPDGRQYAGLFSGLDDPLPVPEARGNRLLEVEMLSGLGRCHRQLRVRVRASTDHHRRHVGSAKKVSRIRHHVDSTDAPRTLPRLGGGIGNADQLDAASSPKQPEVHGGGDCAATEQRDGDGCRAALQPVRSSSRRAYAS